MHRAVLQPGLSVQLSCWPSPSPAAWLSLCCPLCQQVTPHLVPHYPCRLFCFLALPSLSRDVAEKAVGGQVSAGLTDKVANGVLGPSPFHKKSGLNIKILGVPCVLKSAEERGCIKREDQLEQGTVPWAPCASRGVCVVPCLWLCLHEVPPALLRDQKSGDGKGPQGTGRMRKRRGNDFEQVFLQVAPGRLVRAVGGESALRPHTDTPCLLQDSWAQPGQRLGTVHCSPLL